ncbi:hypothetical protein CRG98_023103 [Punica granatum]|uniref:Integrase catalytic domain-containing protein n=1 Tax=Punica granatum TaxID=22663 RepID=A0A2I0JJL4_PUNGR|nr:hypothetical protein CRG98_023103 [Punica granatum]
MVEGLPSPHKQLKHCLVCLEGKQTRLPFRKSHWRATERLQLVHTDVCGPMSVESLNGSKYFVTFIDDKTRMCWIFFMKAKSELRMVFLNFKRLVEKENGCKILAIRLDNGREYISASFKEICEEVGIKHQLTVPYSPQQNGVSERKNRSIVDMTKRVPKSFWAKAANTAVFLQNRLLTKAAEMKTPLEAWSGVKPSVSNLKVFGCICYTYIPSVKRDKLDQKGEVGVFIGYSEQLRAYRVYQPSNGRVIISRDIKFLEDEEWNWNERTQRKSVLKKTQLSVPHITLTETQTGEASVEETGDDPPVRGTRLLADVYQRCNVVMLEPSCFEEANADGK